MQPGLSLVYSSSGGNGVLGMGWTLSGLSSISRCGQSPSINGVTAGVRYTDYSSTPNAQRDRFCLDGQQLIAVSGGYGEDGTQYRTENDQNLKIVSSAGSSVAGAQGPDSFVVQSPNGSVSTYVPEAVTRYSSTSKTGLKAVGTVRVTWVLSSETPADPTPSTW